MTNSETPSADGLYFRGPEGETEQLLLVAGSVRLHFTRPDFYRFVVLALDAEKPFRAYAETCAGCEDSGGEQIVFSTLDSVGSVYDCAHCHFLHVDAFGQRIVIAPSCFWYFLALLRQCAAQLEVRVPVLRNNES
ncbi:MAG: hypothetical protein NW208_02445 [Bryobacter sp.]|nr:hypothetical protein [Bryobacter sp.]